MSRIVLSILVDNTAGVLSRVAGLFSRRGYSIDSLTVGETQESGISRMTVVASGDNQILEQIGKQLSKLEDVREIKELKQGGSVCRELVLVKVHVEEADRHCDRRYFPCQNRGCGEGLPDGGADGKSG